MRVLIRCFCTAKFYDGDQFTADRELAFDFASAQAAIDLIHERKWYDTQIVLAYDGPEKDLVFKAEYLTVPDEVMNAVERWRSVTRENRRGGSRSRQFGKPGRRALRP